MAKLNQIIAIEKGIKTRVHENISGVYKIVQKAELFGGFFKTYKPLDEEGERLPPESKKVQVVVRDALKSVTTNLTELMEVTARKDWSNASAGARATVSVDGKEIVKDAPVGYLLFLEKQLTDFRTFVTNLPVLDANETWRKDENSGLYVSEKVQTHRTKKMQRGITLAPATDKHPAQVQLITDDVLTGHWESIKQSGAMPKPLKEETLDRVDKLIKAVKIAREQANMADEVPSPNVGDAIFGYLVAA